MSINAGNNSSDGDIKEHFFRQFKQEEASLQERMNRLKDDTLQSSERTSIVDGCLAGISQLSNEVKDASPYLPAYEQRTYSTAVKSLNETLQAIRNVSAPKRKFAFKKTVARKQPADPANGAVEDAPFPIQVATGHSAETAFSPEPEPRSSDPTEKQDSLDAGPIPATAGAITIASLSSTYHRLDPSLSKPDSSISLTKVHHSAIDLSASQSSPSATLAINTATESLLICGRTRGAAHITGVHRSTVIIRSRQLRMHDCSHCLVYLRCGSRPIIENCNDIHFSPLPPLYEAAGSPAPGSPNMWDQVDDFSWLRAEHSPNWRALRSGDEGTMGSEAWGVIEGLGSTGCAPSELDDLLRAAKVI